MLLYILSIRVSFTSADCPTKQEWVFFLMAAQKIQHDWANQALKNCRRDDLLMPNPGLAELSAGQTNRSNQSVCTIPLD